MFQNIFDSSDSSDDNENQQPIERTKIYRPTISYSQPSDFRQRFRFTKRQFECLLLEVGPKLRPKVSTNNAVNETQKLLITLRFYASNNFYYDVGDTMGIFI
jgi:hypothetical protein